MKQIFKAFAVAALGVSLFGASTRAQEAAPNADPERSTGRISLTSSQTPQAERNIAVTRAIGNVQDPAGAEPSAFSFNLFPAGDGTLKTGDGKHHTLVSFRSSKVEKLDDDTYRATGKLTVKYVVRIASYDPTEAFSGPAYETVTTRTAQRDASFDFEREHHAGGNGSAGYTNWVATSAVALQAFPELLQAVGSTDWPSYVTAETCTNPGVGTEAYSGAVCTGDEVIAATRTDVQCQAPANAGAEDFSGAVCEGTPVVAVSNHEAGKYAASIVETSGNSQIAPADGLKIVVNLRVDDPQSAMAVGGGK